MTLRHITLILCLLLLVLTIPGDGPGAGATSPTLALTTSGVHQALVWNSHEPTVNGVKAAEVGVIDYVWAASSWETLTNTPGGSAWHEDYTPWARDSNLSSANLAWFQSVHPDWLEYDNDRTTLATYPGSSIPVLDYTNSAVQDWVIATYWKPALVTGGFQGISVDNSVQSDTTAMAGHFDTNGTWVQQYLGQRTSADASYTSAQSAALGQMIAKVHAFAPAATVTVNQAFTCDPGWETFLDGTNGASITFDESGYTNWGDTTPKYIESVNDRNCTNLWLTMTNEYVHIQRDLGKGLILSDGLGYDASTNMTNTNSQAKFDVQWVLATYLLVRYTHTYFWIGNEDTQYGQPPFEQAEFSTANQIGAASGDYYASQNVYMRDFVNGRAIVNPSASATYTVAVPANTYTDLYGNPVTTLSMGPHSGAVLLGASPPPTSTPVPYAYDFEDGTAQGWLGCSNATAHAYSGTHSCATTTTGSGYPLVTGPGTGVSPGQTITYHIYATNSSPPNIVPKVKDSSGVWYDDGTTRTLTAGAWTTVTWTIPSTVPSVARIGFQIRNGAGWTGEIDVDAVAD